MTIEAGKWYKPEDINLDLLEVGKMYLIDLGGGGGVPGEGELHAAQAVENDYDDYDSEEEDSDEEPIVFEDLEGSIYPPLESVFALMLIKVGF